MNRVVGRDSSRFTLEEKPSPKQWNVQKGRQEMCRHPDRQGYQEEVKSQLVESDRPSDPQQRAEHRKEWCTFQCRVEGLPPNPGGGVFPQKAMKDIRGLLEQQKTKEPDNSDQQRKRNQVGELIITRKDNLPPIDREREIETDEVKRRWDREQRDRKMKCSDCLLAFRGLTSGNFHGRGLIRVAAHTGDQSKLPNPASFGRQPSHAGMVNTKRVLNGSAPVSLRPLDGDSLAGQSAQPCQVQKFHSCPSFERNRQEPAGRRLAFC